MIYHKFSIEMLTKENSSFKFNNFFCTCGYEFQGALFPSTEEKLQNIKTQLNHILETDHGQIV